MNNIEVNLGETIEVIQEILDGGGEFRMYPRGKSMRPLIKEARDSVVLVKREKTDIRRYDMLFYRRENGQFVLHRLMRIEKDGTYTMCGDAQTVLEKGIRYEQIIGYVQRMYRKERCVAMDSFSYRFYVRIWSCMFLRRCAIFCARAIRKLARILHLKKGDS